MKYLLLLLLTTNIFAQTIHSSISTYYESKKFKNSLQKYDGVTYGLGADIHKGTNAYKVAFEYGDTQTKQPPLSEDLKTQKLFLKYAHRVNQTFAFNINYLTVLDDNIAITDGGNSYALGLTHFAKEKNIVSNFTQYYSSYDDFSALQSDLDIAYTQKFSGVKLKLNAIYKYIKIDEKSTNSFTKNAQDEYHTFGVKLHIHSNGYHFGTVAYFGKRAFAIMDNGFKIQHHAMEFDRTYSVGVGKNISDFVMRFIYVYQRATELPPQNKNVEVETLRLLLNYKF